MTPEEADAIYYKALGVEYQKYKHDYKPINQRKCDLAGMAAVIEAVEQECTVKFVHKYLEANPLRT